MPESPTYRAVLIGCGRVGATIDQGVRGRPNVRLPYSRAAGYAAADRVALVAAAGLGPDRPRTARERGEPGLLAEEAFPGVEGGPERHAGVYRRAGGRAGRGRHDERVPRDGGTPASLHGLGRLAPARRRAGSLPLRDDPRRLRVDPEGW